jgi:hypothetical protein
MIVDTHAAHRAGSSSGNSDFFNQRAMEHIARCFELMRALELPFNLRTAYNLLAQQRSPQKHPRHCTRAPTRQRALTAGTAFRNVLPKFEK